MSRFFVPSENVKQKEIFVSGKENHHLVRVMRLKAKDDVVVFDNSGKEYYGIIKKVSSQETVIEIKKVQERKEQNKVEITLVQAIPKKAKIEDIIDKTTQLGIWGIIPMITERTIVRPSKEKAYLQRWQKIALESCKQCGRAKPPYINDIVNFKDLISQNSQYDLALMPSLLGKRKGLKEISLQKTKNIIFFIGPEGGWTNQEIELAEKNGVILVDLGERVLRTDTAAIAMTAILNFLVK
ncbi:MAG: 16S rRNA (uracil(1498)-N(3))-methyltransferase [Candidatus Omnitrophica bacterium]|nr:16S rRNA (uracil(1498)-N(3))-methyltransferase [Candidatus Omnitrophota bacterium]